MTEPWAPAESRVYARVLTEGVVRAGEPIEVVRCEDA